MPKSKDNQTIYKISAIKQQVRRSDRYSIYVNGQYSFSLSESELIAQKLRVGLELDHVSLRELREIANTDKLYERCLMLIMRRLRSTQEIRQYLIRKQADADQAETVVVKLTDRGYLDDAVFAVRWVQNRQSLRLSSRNRLRLELRQKGIPPELIDAAMGELEQTDEQTLRELIEYKRLRQKYPDQQKLMQYLARQGYRYDDIRSSVVEDTNQ